MQRSAYHGGITWPASHQVRISYVFCRACAKSPALFTYLEAMKAFILRRTSPLSSPCAAHRRQASTANERRWSTSSPAAQAVALRVRPVALSGRGLHRAWRAQYRPASCTWHHHRRSYHALALSRWSSRGLRRAAMASAPKAALGASAPSPRTWRRARGDLLRHARIAARNAL